MTLTERVADLERRAKRLDEKDGRRDAQLEELFALRRILEHRTNRTGSRMRS